MMENACLGGDFDILHDLQVVFLCKVWEAKGPLLNQETIDKSLCNGWGRELHTMIADPGHPITIKGLQPLFAAIPVSLENAGLADLQQDDAFILVQNPVRIIFGNILATYTTETANRYCLLETDHELVHIARAKSCNVSLGFLSLSPSQFCNSHEQEINKACNPMCEHDIPSYNVELHNKSYKPRDALDADVGGPRSI